VIQHRRLNFILGMLIGLAAFSAGLVGQAYAGTTSTWPITRTGLQQPIRAGFLDLRATATGLVWHSGVDIVVQSDQCYPTAPAGGCRKVYAVTKGHVWKRYGKSDGFCGMLRIGHFGYGHIMSRVRHGAAIRVGQFIGWSCRAEWHVHVSEFAVEPCKTGALDDQSWPVCDRIDPLRRGAALSDPGDVTGPTITPIFEDGYLDANIEDARAPGWLVGAYARLYNDLPPARVDVNGVTLVSTSMNPMPPVAAVMAPEAYRNVAAPLCGADAAEASCAGESIFRLGQFASGDSVTVDAWDSAGNRTTTVVAVP
jgi:hypothetical protein